jgi:hypothetical protein
VSLENFNYYRDPRVIAGMRSRAWTIESATRGGVTLTLHEDLVETLVADGVYPADWTGELTVPAQAVVCGTCDGHGKVVNPSIDAGGIADDDDFWADDYDDETGESRYHRGDYDVPCPECRGLRVVFEPELPPAVSAAVEAWQVEEDAYLRECLAERRMGC